jgi:energy-coupling factor transporter ATP-binding protein EcfA2
MIEEENLFIEQAEYIDEAAFLKWSIEQPDENTIIRKLSQGGAKLITGPRGCGKTTLMLKTFHKLRTDSKAASLPIYVNFKTSLKLEPLYKEGNVNAIFWFNQWLLFKVYQGLFYTLEEFNQTPPSELKLTKIFVDKVTSQLELAQINKLSDDENHLLTISSLEADIKKVLKFLNKTRCVLLLDDAAHTFSPEQQRDFFDFFRQVKSRIISPKAAIYPGVTIYSANFHIGHDAEEIDVWIKPDSSNYLDFMFEILERRLPSAVYYSLWANKPLLQLVCYAAFGMPRTLLNMIRRFYKRKSISSDVKPEFKMNFNKAKALESIKLSFNDTLKIYESLKVQLPIYEKFILTGEQLFDTMSNRVKEFNKNKEIGHHSVAIGIKYPLPAELSKVLGFFEYVGILLPKGKINKGEKGTFEIYVIHYGALILRNALLNKSSISVIDLSKALMQSSLHYWPRIWPNILIGTDELSSVFQLALPPCQKCKTPRVNEHAKFCINCGTVLKNHSTFDEIVKHDIEYLGLTKKRVQTIKKHSHIRTIKDILMDHDNRELRGVPGIGEIWAKRIGSRAEEYIS